MIRKLLKITPHQPQPKLWPIKAKNPNELKKIHSENKKNTRISWKRARSFSENDIVYNYYYIANFKAISNTKHNLQFERLCSFKMSGEKLENLLHFWNKKTQFTIAKPKY